MLSCQPSPWSLLGVVSVSLCFIGQVRFAGSVAYWLNQVLQIARVSICKGLITFHSVFGSVLFLLKVGVSLYRVSASEWFCQVVNFLILAKVFVVSKICSRWVWGSFSGESVGVPRVRPTQRALDWRVRAAFFGIFLAQTTSVKWRYLVPPASK